MLRKLTSILALAVLLSGAPVLSSTACTGVKKSVGKTSSQLRHSMNRTGTSIRKGFDKITGSVKTGLNKTSGTLKSSYTKMKSRINRDDQLRDKQERGM